MQVGDLVRHYYGYIGIITRKLTFDETKVEVHWNDGGVCYISVSDLEAVCK